MTGTTTERPMPGPRRPREIWTGRSEVWLSEVSSDPAEPMRNVAGGGLRTSNRMLTNVVDRERRRRRARSSGVDAARGFALIGMFAIHMLPAAREDGTPTLVWQLLAGNSAALFAVLAGVSLAFNSGAERPFTGTKMNRSRANVAIRGLLLISLGVGLNQIGLAAFDILPYFGVMFLLAIPLLPLRARTLLITGAVMIVVLPLVRFLIHRQVDGFGWHPNPTLATIISAPVDVLSSLLITGAYPGLTWFALVCIGMGIGRLQLHFTTPRMLIIVAGGTAMLFAIAVTRLLVYLNRFGGYTIVRTSFPGKTTDAVDDFLVYGPTGPLPTASPGWLISGGPHTNTPFAFLIGVGFAMAAIGTCILIARRSNLLRPLVMIGRIPTSVYVSHLIFLTMAPDDVGAFRLFIVQCLFAFLFTAVWLRFFKRGPVEAVITAVTRALTKLLGFGASAGSSVVRA
ncbi:heparan-alpha-glucosaminide N-acetyltransferase domain-containing protein [Brevibacterium sp. 'Marine']|uniref:heparan-alpha-glucosaminide N-acetyltransferase domain-containing protein n=1 Tax=Brevibacterium sp. 'Marine' TaxID=2725563 RepID=UPI00145D10CE|nr:heparan-alpha-glucosaminide N-acetyltransferase domain-containing protein [Brevibacterium sp. 'Marine']